jgi:hypothetical protein
VASPRNTRRSDKGTILSGAAIIAGAARAARSLRSGGRQRSALRCDRYRSSHAGKSGPRGNPEHAACCARS